MAEVEMHEECGVLGIFTTPAQAAELHAAGSDLIDLTYWGVDALQNRGRDSAGIAANDAGAISVVKGFGSIPESLPAEKRAALPRSATITVAQNRYATAVGNKPIDPMEAVQPFYFGTRLGGMALGHNGNLVNDRQLAVQNGYTGRVPSDSWLIGALMRDEINNGRSFVEASQRVFPRLQGAFSVVTTQGEQLIGARDPNGIRPLHLGRIAGGYVLASETGAFYAMGADESREIKPGEMVVIDTSGEQTIEFAEAKLKGCAFEFLYFARPDQRFNGRSVRQARIDMGRQLALEAYVDADGVIGVPFSGRLAGEGYADAAGLPDIHGLEKVEDIRSFIADNQAERTAIARRKLKSLPGIEPGKDYILVEDSIVRGTSIPETIKIVREAGARKVHVRVASPPILWPCFYGVNMESPGELIAANKSIEEIRTFVDADSLEYLSLEGLKKAVGIGDDLCTGCFDGQYPTELPAHLRALTLQPTIRRSAHQVA